MEDDEARRVISPNWHRNVESARSKSYLWKKESFEILLDRLKQEAMKGYMNSGKKKK